MSGWSSHCLCTLVRLHRLHYHFVFFTATASSQIYTLSLHDALPISSEQSPEYGWIRNYLDWMLELPWDKRSEDNFDLVDRKSTRLNSSHVRISYAVFCLKKKKTK